MKRILLILFLITCFSKKVQAGDDLGLRSLFYQASYHQIEAQDFLNHINQISEADNPIVFGYKGMAYMLLSKESWNPFAKFDYFNKGKDFLEQAIEKDQSNIELRFLRLCIQTSVPAILNYDSDIKNDQEYLLAHYKSISDTDLQDKILVYLEENQLLTSKNEQ